MKIKILAIIAVFLLTGPALTGCDDNQDGYTQRELYRRERERGSDAPLPPLPPRNPDGSLG